LEREVLIWDTVTGKVRATLRPRGFPLDFWKGAPGFLGVEFSPDGRRLALLVPSGDPKKQHAAVKVWDTATGQELLSIGEATGLILNYQFSPDGKHLHTFDIQTGPVVWDAVTGRKLLGLQAPRVPHKDSSCDVAWSADGTRLATLDTPMTGVGPSLLAVWGFASGKQLWQLEVAGRDTGYLQFSPDGTRLAAFLDPFPEKGGSAGEVRMWDAVTGATLFTFQGHSGRVTGLAFSPDGRRLATLGHSTRRSEVKLWDVATGQELLTLKNATGFYNLFFSRDGRRLIASSPYGQHPVRVWDATPLPEAKDSKRAARP
jgi:WD40 repeat protein